jgi:uncharacterized protein (DUF4415 family)
MNKKDTLNRSQTDWERLEAMTDKDIDFSDIPELTDEQLKAMRPTRELIPALSGSSKEAVTVQLDSDIVQFLKSRADAIDANLQTLINATLRDYMYRNTNRGELRALVREIVREELNKAS